MRLRRPAPPAWLRLIARGVTTIDCAVLGPVPTGPRNPIFSAADRAVVPLDLASFGYLEEEYFLSGSAHRYAEGLVPDGGPHPYTTRLVVRRPVEAPSGATFVSIFNASLGYDMEDDWRRAWDWLIENRHTYVGVTLKPISIEALRTFNPARYSSLGFEVEGQRPRPAVTASIGWDPWQVVPGCEEGLAWDVLVDLAGLARDPGIVPGGSRRVFLTGQSQSGVYVNTFAAHVHNHRRRGDGGPLFDGYLAGVASVLTRPLWQEPGGVETWRVGPTPELDVPLIAVTADGDLDLYALSKPTAYPRTGNPLPDPSPDPYARGLGDGPLRRQYQVAGAPHSDARSPVIPDDRDIVRAGRLPRNRTQELVQRLNPMPLEPVMTGAFAALLRWVDEGIPAPPSTWFDQHDGLPYVNEYGITAGGLRLGLVEHPLGTYHGAAAEDAKYGGAELFGSYDVTRRFRDLEAHLAACEAVDDALEAAGYLEPVGRRLLRRVSTELWARVVGGAPAHWATPQGPELQPSPSER